MIMQPYKSLIIDSGELEHKRQEICQYFHTICDLHEKLYETLKNDFSFYQRPESPRHPLVF